MCHRISILILNLLFPPLAVMIMTGLTSPETILNTILFFLAVIPSHIHGFYVSWKYFRRDEKLERYQWEGVRRDGRGRRRSHSGGSDTLSGSGSHGGKQRVYRGEVEEYSSDDGDGRASGRGRPVDRLQYVRPMYMLSDVPPPPCPTPPVHGYGLRYLQ